jgi:hypothetical protein
MTSGGNERTSWGRVAAVLIGLFVLAMVVSLVLKLIRLLVIIALLFVAALVVLRAIRPRGR